jgi:hypothetical protein
MLTKEFVVGPIDFELDSEFNLGTEIGDIASLDKAFYKEQVTGSVRPAVGVGSSADIPGSFVLNKGAQDGSTSLFVVPPAGIVGHGTWYLHLVLTYMPPVN